MAFVLQGKENDMKTQKHLICLIALALFALLLSNCQTDAPPETRAGEWTASTDCGVFTLYVSDDGTAINKMKIASRFKDLGSVKLVAGNTAVELKDPGDLEDSIFSKASRPFNFDGRELTMTIGMANLTIVSLDATFRPNGKRLSGTAHFYPQEEGGGCKTKFQINR